MIPPGKIDFFWTTIYQEKDIQFCHEKYPIQKHKDVIKDVMVYPELIKDCKI